MTDQFDGKQDVVANQAALAWEGQSVDWYLQNLVSVVNGSNISFGITLFVEGVVISGTLVSGKKYFETFADEFSSAYPGDDEVREGIRQAFASNASLYDNQSKSKDLPPPQFIHLIDCYCHSPQGGSLPSDSGTLWRGKINAVSGFNLGSLT